MINVAVTNAHPRRRVKPREVRKYVRTVVRGEGMSDARVSVVFIDNRRCAMLHAEFFGVRKATDVMSFPLERGTVVDGEVYVNLDRARVQARSYGVSESNEIARLVAHGTLHLLGYRDSSAAAAKRMTRRQESYVSKWF
jgi:probable rRNA maturation factor